MRRPHQPTETSFKVTGRSYMDNSDSKTRKSLNKSSSGYGPSSSSFEDVESLLDVLFPVTTSRVV